MSKEKTLIFYKNWWDTLRKLDDATLMPLLRQLFEREFADGDGVADISTNTGMALAFIYDAIERDRTKYQAVCDKRAEAGKRHKGNQHSSASLEQMEQTEQMFQFGTNGTNGTNGTDNDNKNKNDNENKNDNDFLFFLRKDRATMSPEEKEKEKVLEDLSLSYLENGIPFGWEEANAFYDYNEALGWVNGTTKVANKVAWAKGWTTEHGQEIPIEQAQLFRKAMKRFTPAIVNGFKGLQFDGDKTLTVMFATPKARLDFQELLKDAATWKHFEDVIHETYPRVRTYNLK